MHARAFLRILNVGIQKKNIPRSSSGHGKEDAKDPMSIRIHALEL